MQYWHTRNKCTIAFFAVLAAMVWLCLPLGNVEAAACQDGHRSCLCCEWKQQPMDVLNNSPYHITALFICPANSEEWQEVLGGIELRSGNQRKVIFDVNSKVYKWDIKVVDSSGNFTVFQNQRIKPDFTSIDYYYKDGTGHIKFAVG